MIVNVEYMTSARDVTKKANEQADLNEQTTAGDLLDKLTAKYGSGFKKAVEYKDGVFMFISRKGGGYRSVPGRETVLEDGDSVIFGGVIVGG